MRRVPSPDAKASPKKAAEQRSGLPGEDQREGHDHGECHAAGFRGELDGTYDPIVGRQPGDAGNHRHEAGL